jgi:hypothetical protein
MEYPASKQEHHKYESIIHVGFLESLDRCTTTT